MNTSYKITFKCERDDGDEIIFVYKDYYYDIDQHIDQFKHFLLAIGFVINSEDSIELVKADEMVVKEPPDESYIEELKRDIKAANEKEVAALRYNEKLQEEIKLLKHKVYNIDIISGLAYK